MSKHNNGSDQSAPASAALGEPWGGAGWPPRAARPPLSVCFLLTSALSISCTPTTGVQRVLSCHRQHRGRFRPVNGFLSCSITVSAGDAAHRRPDGLLPPSLLPVSHGCWGFWPQSTSTALSIGAIPQKPSPGRTRGPPAGWVLTPSERVAAHAWLRPPRNLLDMDTFSKSDPGGWPGCAAGGVSAAWQGTARLRSSLRSGRPLRAGRGEQRVEGGERRVSHLVPPYPTPGVLQPPACPLLANPRLG